jgi:hypothetical protein
VNRGRFAGVADCSWIAPGHFDDPAIDFVLLATFQGLVRHAFLKCNEAEASRSANIALVWYMAFENIVFSVLWREVVVEIRRCRCKRKIPNVQLDRSLLGRSSIGIAPPILSVPLLRFFLSIRFAVRPRFVIVVSSDVEPQLFNLLEDSALKLVVVSHSVNGKL